MMDDIRKDSGTSKYDVTRIILSLVNFTSFKLRFVEI